MKLIKNLIAGLLLVCSAQAAEQMDASQVKKKFSIVEGDYKLVSKDNQNCVSGKLEVFKGNDGILSLKMGNGLLAKHLDVAKYSDDEKGCRLLITNSKMKNGFTNDENMVCENSKSSYSRTFKAEFKDNKFNYELRYKREKKAGKIVTACYLVKIK